MDKLELKFSSEYHTVSILINDINLMDLKRNRDEKTGELSHNEHSELNIRYIVNALYYNDKDDFLNDDKQSILGCCCGDRDCGPFRVKIIETDDTIIWTDFKSRYSEYFRTIDKLEFEKEKYMEQVESLNEIMKSVW